MTTPQKPQDKVFADFEKNWSRFISASPDLARPVVTPRRAPDERPWQPQVVADCTFSADAAGLVPQATLSWDAPLVGDSASHGSTPQAGESVPRLRFDLSLHHNGFGRNYFSSALASDKPSRFMLPSTSGLVDDKEAVLLTGPGLFPKLVDFSVQVLQDRDSGRKIERLTLVLRDLSAGLSYTIRLDRPSGNEWRDEGQFVFLTPVCPSSF